MKIDMGLAGAANLCTHGRSAVGGGGAQGAGEAACGEFIHVNWHHRGKLLW